MLSPHEVRHPPVQVPRCAEPFSEASDWPFRAEGHLPGRGDGPTALLRGTTKGVQRGLRRGRRGRSIKMFGLRMGLFPEGFRYEPEEEAEPERLAQA